MTESDSPKPEDQADNAGADNTGDGAQAEGSQEEVSKEAHALTELQYQVAKLEKQIADDVIQIQRSTKFTALIVVALLLLVAGYFHFGYRELEELTKPKSLVHMADGLLAEYIPVARQTLQDAVNDSADEWAQQLSHEAFKGVPLLREKLQNYILDQYDAKLSVAAAVPDAEIRAFLKNNHDSLELRLKELSASPELSKKTLEELEKMLNEQIGYNMREQAALMFETLRMLNRKLKILLANKQPGDRPLDEEQRLERQIVMVCKRLQIEEQDPELKKAVGYKKPSSAAIQSAVDSSADESVKDGAADGAESKK